MDAAPPQPTVLVTGGVEAELRSVATALFDERAAGSDGAVVVTTRESPATVVRRLTDGSDRFDRDRLALVDARDADVAKDADDAFDVGHRQRLDPGIQPGRMDEAISTGLEWLADAGVERRHFLYDTLATGYRSPDEAAAYDRAYRVAMTVGSEDGLALFTLDDEGLPADVVERLGHLVDVHVELREHQGSTQLRWTGLLDAAEDWVALADAELGVGGFR